MNVAEQWNVLTNARKSIPVPVHELLGRLGIKLKQAWLADGISGMLENIGEKAYAHDSDPINIL